VAGKTRLTSQEDIESVERAITGTEVRLRCSVPLQGLARDRSLVLRRNGKSVDSRTSSDRHFNGPGRAIGPVCVYVCLRVPTTTFEVLSCLV